MKRICPEHELTEPMLKRLKYVKEDMEKRGVHSIIHTMSNGKTVKLDKLEVRFLTQNRTSNESFSSEDESDLTLTCEASESISYCSSRDDSSFEESEDPWDCVLRLADKGHGTITQQHAVLKEDEETVLSVPPRVSNTSHTEEFQKDWNLPLKN